MDATSTTTVPYQPPERLLTTAEVALQLNLTERQVARLRQAKRLASVPLTGSAVRHTQQQVNDFIAACTVEAVR